MRGGKFLKLWQGTDKISEFLCNSHSTFYEWLTQKITRRLSKIYELMWGDVYE